jgi:hypothetical protein
MVINEQLKSIVSFYHFFTVQKLLYAFKLFTNIFHPLNTFMGEAYLGWEYWGFSVSHGSSSSFFWIIDDNAPPLKNSIKPTE